MTLSSILFLGAAFSLGAIVGILLTWYSLHLRFDVPLSEDIWPLLRLRTPYKPKPIKLVIAGNYGQFKAWLRENVKYVASVRDLIEHRPEDVEIIKIGPWWHSPVASSPFLERFEVEDL